MVTKTLYEVLEVTEDASVEEIKAAFKKLAKKYHPDVAEMERGEAEERFKEIAAAYTVLSSESQRRKYDQNFKYGSFRIRFQPRYEWVYQSYIDDYVWSPKRTHSWNEHHDAMYR